MSQAGASNRALLGNPTSAVEMSAIKKPGPVKKDLLGELLSPNTSAMGAGDDAGTKKKKKKQPK